MRILLNKINVTQVIVNSIIVLLLFLTLYPLAMTFWGAFKSEYIFQTTKFYPTLPLRVTNISTMFPVVWKYIFNTIIIAAVGVGGSLFISSISAYTFARMKFVGKNVIYVMVISLMMIPAVLTLVPSFMVYKSFFGLDNYAIQIAPIIVGGPIFGIFLLRAFFEGLPESIFESARIDGATEFRIYRSICLPMSLPILGTLSIMQIANVWNDYMWPIITIQSDKIRPISAGLLATFSNADKAGYTLTFTAYLLACLPLILLFTFANKHFVEGLSSSGLKL